MSIIATQPVTFGKLYFLGVTDVLMLLYDVQIILEWTKFPVVNIASNIITKGKEKKKKNRIMKICISSPSIRMLCSYLQIFTMIERRLQDPPLRSIRMTCYIHRIQYMHVITTSL